MLANNSLQNLFVMSIGCFVISIWTFNSSDYKSASQTKHWPSTEGTIVQSQIHHVNPNHVNDSFRPDVSYTYKVNGLSYQSSSIYKGNKKMGYSQKFSAQKITNQFPVGKTVRVYYSPVQAQDSVLIPGPVRLHYLFLLMSIFAFLAGCYFLWTFYLSYSKK